MHKQYVVCKSNGCDDMSFADRDEHGNGNHEIMLDLSIQKTGNIFVADQTPTPTRLIKNCEEVGLFDDLRHVNPFEETFRRAVEQNVCQTPNTRLDTAETHAEDSLHTPQVFPQLEDPAADGVGYRCSPTSAGVVDLLTAAVNSFGPNSTSRQSSSGCSSATILGYDKVDKYRIVTEKATPPPLAQNANENGDHGGGGIRIVYDLPPSMIQLIPAQDITWYSSPTIASSEATKQGRITAAAATAIPIQTVKPFILPKQPEPQPLNTHIIPTVTATHIAAAPSSQQHTHEPSSASLTPTSQLPIKERLKAILHLSSKSRIVELPQKSTGRRPQGQDPRSHVKYDDDCIERRRAAATRYRVKMRNEYKDLRRQNTELQTDNEKLRQRVRQLEQELAKQQQQQQFVMGGVLPAQIQIPPSTVHVVMNIPKLVVPSNGGQPILQNPLTYMVEKK